MGTMRAAGWAWACARSGHRAARSARAGQAELPKRKPSLKKLWPQVWALVAPRKGLLVIGMGLMVHQPRGGSGVALHQQAAAR